MTTYLPDSLKLNPSRLFLLLLLIAALGLFLRVNLLSQLGAYWYDEIIAVEIAQKPFLDSWHYLSLENSPPLYFWLLRVWGLIFGFEENVTRLFSVAVGIITIFAIYYLGKLLFNKSVGLIVAFLFSIVPTAIYLNTEARMYSLLFLFICLSLYFFWRFINAPNFTLHFFIGYILTTIAMLYTHLTGFALIFVEILYIFLLFKRKKHCCLKEFVLAILIIFLLFSPYLFIFLGSKFEIYQEGLLSRGWYFREPPSPVPILITAPVAFLDLFYESRPLLHSSPIIISSFFLLTLFFLGYSLIGAGKSESVFSDNQPVLLLFLIFFIPLLAASLFSNIAVYKYFLASTISFYLLLALGIKQIFKTLLQPAVKKSLAAGSTILMIILLFSAFSRWNLYNPYENLYSFITEEKAELIVADPVIGSMILKHYLKQPSPPVLLISGPNPPRLKYKKNGEPDDILEYSIRYNWSYSYAYNYTRGERIELLNQIDAGVPPQTERIAYIFLLSPQESVVREALRAKGFTSEMRNFWAARDPVRLVLMTRPKN